MPAMVEAKATEPSINQATIKRQTIRSVFLIRASGLLLGGVVVIAVTPRIHLLVGNLFDNELKHLPTECTVAIQLQVDHDLASLRIEDDGPGFAPDVIDHLFKSRVKGKESSGHGFGLAFVDAVTRAHGGAVTASNREEGGARITVTLPLAAYGHIDSPPKAVHESAPIPSGEVSD